MEQPHRAETQQDALKNHQRETRLQVILPVALGGVALVVALVIAALLPQIKQTSAVSNFLVTLLLLCPTALCLLPLVLVLTVAALYMNRVHSGAAGALGRVVTLSEKLSTRVDAATYQVARRAIDVSAKLAPIEKHVLGVFDPPASTTPKEANHVPTAPTESRK